MSKYWRGPLSWMLIWLCEAAYWSGEGLRWPPGFWRVYQWAGLTSTDMQTVKQHKASWFGPWLLIDGEYGPEYAGERDFAD